MSPCDVETIALRMLRDVYSDGGQIQGSAMAAIESACWDIMGKATGQPLHNLIGGRCRDSLRCYANGWYRGPRTPESFHEKARAVVERGHTALKFDPFGAAWRTFERREFDLSVEIIAAVRDAVGPEVDIMAEGHNRFSAHTALQLAEAMTPYQPAWFETPVPPHLISSIVEVAKRSPVPIACGEDYYRSFGTVRRAPQARSGAHRPARAAVPRHNSVQAGLRDEACRGRRHRPTQRAGPDLLRRLRPPQLGDPELLRT